MLYFPLCEWNWPQWMPWIGGNHFVFFQPIFNVADAALTVSVFVLILFYARYFSILSTKEETVETEETEETDGTEETDMADETVESEGEQPNNEMTD